MANEELRVKIAAQVQGLDQVESLKNAVRQLQNSATPAAADLQKLKNAAMQLGSATNRTESDLRKSIGALRDVKSQLSITDAEYKKLTSTINKYQAQLDKATGAQQRQGRGMQFAQTAGAVAASGVFGGPEGLVGAGVGAFFGPGGALAGGAIGAQVGAIRQQLGGTAILAADLEKQRTALRLVLKDSAEYNASLQFLAKTSREYAIPQDRLVKGFTQLAASVAGAGGNINDTKTAFQGIAAGIRGTGGSLENLDAALLATSQVFSKGKVSAEELRGQIGERLPGAFTLFAQSIGKTPQELDKALESGEVSLLDFLKFSKTLLGEYGENAKIIADSPAAAGDRLQTNLKNLSETVGKLLQPIGAAFQNTFSEIVKYIDAAATRLANFLGMNKTNVEKIGELNNIIIIQQRAIQRERDKLKAGTTSKESAAYNIREFEARVATAQGELKVIKALEKATEQQSKTPRAGLGGASPAENAAANKQAADKAAKDAAALAAEQQRLAEATAQAQIRLAETVFRAQTDFDRKRYDLQQELINKERELRVAALTGVASQAAASTAQFFRAVDELQRRRVEAGAGIIGAQRGLGNAQFMQSVTGASAGAPSIAGFTPQQLTSATKAAAKFTGVANMCSESVKAFYGSLGISLPGVTAWADTVRKAGTVMRDWSKLAPGDIVATGRPGDTPHVGVYTGGNNVFHQSRGRGLKAGNFPDLDYFKRQGYFVRPGAVAGKQPTGVAAQMRRNTADQGDVAIAQVDYDMAVKYKTLLEEMVQKRLPQEVQLFALEGAKAYNEQTKALRDNVAELQARQSLEFSGASQEAIDGELKKLQVTRDYTAQVNELKHQLTQKEALENPIKAEGLRNAIAAITQGYTDQKAAIDELTRAQIAYNEAQRDPGVILRAAATQARTDMSSLVNVGNQVVGAANAIGSSFGTAFKGLVSGSMSAKEALASFFQSTADYFLDMASKIITQWITMTILNSVLKLFPGGSGAAGIAGGGLAGSSLPGGFANPLVGAYTNANGNAFAANGIVPYAKGGIVDRPTMFKFAKGGAMQTGIMGEAGAEAVMPLKRGPDGKLGVAATGGGGVNVVVNVDAKGSAVQGDQGQGNELGRAIAGAVQAELIKQQRPGGLLTR